MKINKVVLGYYGILFLGFGLFGLLVPGSAAQIAGYGLQSSIAKMEFMATYGGLFLGVGAFMIYCLRSNVRLGLVSVVFTMSAMLVTRLAGFALALEGNAIQYIYLAGELFTVVLVGFLLLRPTNIAVPVSGASKA